MVDGGTRPSRTARVIAAARAVGTAGTHDPLAIAALPPRDASAAAALHALVARHPTVDAATRLATGGLTTHAVLRMRIIDRAVIEAVGAGCRQVVIVGAGLDTRAWRLEALAGATVYEVDRGALQARKRARLAGRDPLSEVRFVPADLAEQDLGEVLAAARHDPTEPTVWVWEAVTMYLPRGAVDDTLGVIAARSVPGSHLALTYLAPDLVASRHLGRVVAPAARAVLAASGEPLVTTMTDRAVRRALVTAGFTPLRVGDLRAQHPGSALADRRDLFAGERFALGVVRERP